VGQASLADRHVLQAGVLHQAVQLRRLPNQTFRLKGKPQETDTIFVMILKIK
jgi:hypothetical protein